MDSNHDKMIQSHCFVFAKCPAIIDRPPSAETNFGHFANRICGFSSKRVTSQLSTISRSVLLCVAIDARSSAGFGTLRWRRSRPGIQPHPYTCQARVESFPHAAVRGSTLDPPLHCLFGATPLPKALSKLSRSPRLFLTTQGPNAPFPAPLSVPADHL